MTVTLKQVDSWTEVWHAVNTVCYCYFDGDRLGWILKGFFLNRDLEDMYGARRKVIRPAH